MKTTTYLSVSILVLAATLSVARAQGVGASQAARIGEVREFAVAPGNTKAIAQLHHDGWLEARGQLLPAQVYPALYGVVGRTWTAAEVVEGGFAVPDLRDTSQRSISSANSYGVLGPGDLVTSGRPSRPWLRSSPLTYWIFTGKDMTRPELFRAGR
jgi:hypothetical protein